MRKCASLAFGLVLMGCGGGSSAPDSGPASDAQLPCVMGDTDPALPDIVTQPLISPPVAVPGNTITAAISVDAQTKYVSLVMLNVDRSAVVGGADQVTDGATTVTLNFETMAQAPLGDYFFTINVCTSRDACITEERGISYAPLGTPVAAQAPLVRTDYDGPNELGSAETCYEASIVTLSN